MPSSSRRCSSSTARPSRPTPTSCPRSSVKAEVVKAAKGPKIVIMKFKNKTGYRKRQGHRQPLTQVKITAINA